MSNKENEALEVIFSRKSVRKYTGQVATKEELGIILKAAMAAPSGRNQQPWAFIVLTDPATLEKLAEGLPYAKMLPQAGAGLVVCGYSAPPTRPGGRDLWEQDCAAATQNILLAAEAMGLGAVWTAVHPYPEREEYIRRVLGIPSSIIPFSVIPIGHPVGDEQPKEKFRQSNVHWERW